MQPLKYVLTRESAIIEHDGKTTTVKRGAANFEELRRYLLNEDWAGACAALSVEGAVAAWSRGRFRLAGLRLECDGEAVPQQLSARILALLEQRQDPAPLLRFWERLKTNPSQRSREQLYGFMANVGIPVSSDGTFLAYKGVTAEHKDVYTKSFDNRPGSVHTMPRHEVSDDANVACHAGFHVGALEYATWFLEHEAVAGGHVVICRVAPEDVVCVPKDHSMKKVRVWRYEVVGEWSGEALPSEVVGVEEMPDDEDEQEHVTDANATIVCAAPLATHSVAPPPQPRPVPRRYRKYLTMSVHDLLMLPIAELRATATHGLAIVGASKLPGGKVALVSRIVDVRASYGAAS